MAILIEDTQMERLAEQIAVADGVSINEVLRASLLSLAGTRGLIPPKVPLRERLAKLAQEVDAIPPRNPPDTRSDDEVLGYNDADRLPTMNTTLISGSSPHRSW
ncbi:hypothetical protein AGMMS50256_11650 [Betaproteobacteria bacterium]|nr:hypothetical protein AGMMS50256_11650 [Betaproteobacteria bacterium]